MSKKAELLESVLREMVTEEATAARESLAGEMYNSPEFEKSVSVIVDAMVESKISDSFGSRSFKRDMTDLISDAIDDIDMTSVRGFQRSVEGVIDDYDFSDKIEDAVRDAIDDHDFSDKIDGAVRDAIDDHDFSINVESVLEDYDFTEDVERTLNTVMKKEGFQLKIEEAVEKVLEARTKTWRETMLAKIEKFEALLAEIKEAVK